MIKDLNFGEALKSENNSVFNRLKDINSKLQAFLSQYDKENEMKQLSLQNDKKNASGALNESQAADEEMKVSIMSKLREIEQNAKNTDKMFDNLTPSLTKMDSLFQELTRKASKRISNTNIGNLSPTLFSAKHHKKKFETDEFNIDLKQSDQILEEYELATDSRAQAMELELKALEREEKDLETYLDQMKKGVVVSRTKHKRSKSEAKFRNRRLDALIKKRDHALKDEFKHKIGYNDNYFIKNADITNRELTLLIHYNQEKIIAETNSIERLKHTIQQVHDDNPLLDILSKNKEDIANGNFVAIDKESNTLFYNKNIIFRKEIDRLARENDKLREYYTNLATKLQLLK